MHVPPRVKKKIIPVPPDKFVKIKSSFQHRIRAEANILPTRRAEEDQTQCFNVSSYTLRSAFALNVIITRDEQHGRD